jgi:hypothetical protein
MSSIQLARDLLAIAGGTLPPSLYSGLYEYANSTNPFAVEPALAPAPAPAPAPARAASPIVGKANAITQAYLANIPDGTSMLATHSKHKHYASLKIKTEVVKVFRDGIHCIRHNGTDYASPTALFKALIINRNDSTKHIWFCHNGVYKTMWDAFGVQPTQVAPTA